jgi:hypothetical protein
LNNKVKAAQSELKIKEQNLTKQKAFEINSNMESIMKDINGLVEENILLKEKQGVPVSTTFDTRKRISSNLFQT